LHRKDDTTNISEDIARLEYLQAADKTYTEEVEKSEKFMKKKAVGNELIKRVLFHKIEHAVLLW